MSATGRKRTFRIVGLLLLATNKAKLDEATIGVVGNPCGKAIEGAVGADVRQNDRSYRTRSNNLCRRMAFRDSCFDCADTRRRAVGEWRARELLGVMGHQ